MIHIIPKPYVSLENHGFHLEVMVSFLEWTFTKEDGIEVAFPVGAAPLSLVQDFQLVHIVGFTLSLAAKLILAAAVALKPDDAEMMEILDVLKCTLVIHMVTTIVNNEEEAVYSSLEKRFQISETIRPDLLEEEKKGAEKTG